MKTATRDGRLRHAVDTSNKAVFKVGRPNCCRGHRVVGVPKTKPVFLHNFLSVACASESFTWLHFYLTPDRVHDHMRSGWPFSNQMIDKVSACNDVSIPVQSGPFFQFLSHVTTWHIHLYERPTFTSIESPLLVYTQVADLGVLTPAQSVQLVRLLTWWKRTALPRALHSSSVDHRR